MSNRISRRKFLTGAAAAVAAPYVVPASVLGQGGTTPPSDRITVGCIGIHNRGIHDLRWIIGNDDVQIVAICDVWKQQRLAVKEFVDNRYGNKDCAMYQDMREFLLLMFLFPHLDFLAVLPASGFVPIF